MAGFDHGSTGPKEVEDMVLAARNARLGMKLFLLYLSVYAGFVLLNAFWPDVTARPALFGMNIAVTYGFGLIVLALILALIYCWMCQAKTPTDQAPKT